jgi:hypothetical protein
MESPKPRLRWFQFSLRTLLIVVTLAAIACSWFGVKLQQKRREREVAAEIEKSGGFVFWSEPAGPDWLRKMLGDELLVHVESVGMGIERTDAALDSLKALNQLQELSLCNSDVTDAGLENLEGLHQLQELSLANTNVSDAGLEHLRGLCHLRVLDLTGSPRFTDAGMEHLKGLNQLQELWLGCGTRVTDRGVRTLQQALRKCQVDCWDVAERELESP